MGVQGAIIPTPRELSKKWRVRLTQFLIDGRLACGFHWMSLFFTVHLSGPCYQECFCFVALEGIEFADAVADTLVQC